MQANAVERVADDDRRAEPGVEKRLDAQLIARAEQALSRCVPDEEGEVAGEVRHTLLAPPTVGAEDQLGIGGIDARLAVASLLKLGDEVGARIDARVGDDPALAVECQRLRFPFGLAGDFEQRVAKASIAAHFHGRPVWTAKR